VLIPVGLVWVMVTGAAVVLRERYGDRSYLLIAAGVLGLMLLVSMIAPLFSRKAMREVST
jgi:hypothetical protein